MNRQSAVSAKASATSPAASNADVFMDDIRPLMTLTKSDDKPYGWANNTGGGDFLMWVDRAGDYQGFCQTRTDYISYGPCLTHAAYIEKTLGGEIACRMDVSIARSDDYLRAFHHIHYEIKRPLSWRRLAFYQLGADFYNETPAYRVAIGNAAGMTREWETPRGKDRYDRQSIPLEGAQPWVGIHGVNRDVMKPGQALASRGLIVRAWDAVLGGRRGLRHAEYFNLRHRMGNGQLQDGGGTFAARRSDGFAAWRLCGCRDRTARLPRRCRDVLWLKRRFSCRFVDRCRHLETGLSRGDG